MKIIDGKSMIYVLKRTLDQVDTRLVAHGERVAYILYDMLRACDTDLRTIIQVCIMGLLHDIGAYKTEEIDRLIEFETKNVASHAIYGYLYLRNWLPRGENAEMILFHHMPDRTLHHVSDRGYHRFANMIHLADRLDIYFRSHKAITEPYLEYLKSYLISPELVDLFVVANEKYGTIENLMNGSYESMMTALSEKIDFTEQEMVQYLMMIVFAIDFRSEHTVNHNIIAIELASELASLMGLPEVTVKKVRIGAMLHDLGKISTPIAILEKPTALTPEETIIMKNHVVMTRKIIEGYVDEEICRIAYRHHERLNGKGYPEGLRDEDLTLPEKIMAVADITSALLGKRSYKNPFPKSEIMKILSNMVKNGDIASDVVDVLLANYNEICERVYKNAQELTIRYASMKTEFVELHHWYDTLS